MATDPSNWNGGTMIAAIIPANNEEELAAACVASVQAAATAPELNGEQVMIVVVADSLAMLARDRTEVCVVAVTDGGASHPGSSRWSAPLLAVQRRTESLEGLALLGLALQIREALGVPDGQVRSHTRTIICWLRKFLRPDDVVLSTWELDGHPDHEASAQATAMACATTGARHIQVPVWMWHWASPADTRVPWRRMVRLQLSADALHRKKLALRAHRTQLEPRETGRRTVLEPGTIARRMRPLEFFILPA